MDIFMRELRALIRELQIELPLNNSFLRNILNDQRNRALRVRATEAMQLIRELQDSLYKVEYSDNWPLLRILIAFCYCRLNDIHSARLWAEDAVRILKATNKESNLALAYWFLAEIYSQESYFKDSREQYINAQNTLQQIRNNALISNAGYKSKKECSRRIRHIQRRINGIAQESSRLLDSARKDQTVNIRTESHEPTTEQSDEHTSVGNVLIAPINVNVHVPINNRFADHVDQSSVQHPPLHKDQFSKQEQESQADAAIPSAIDFTNTTKQPSYSSPTSVDNHKTANLNHEAPMPTEVFDFGYLMTPSLPVYGSASAGRDGQVYFDEPNYDVAIDESSLVTIETHEHRLFPIKWDIPSITISYQDFVRSIRPPNQNQKNGGIRYGWLRVVGNSMNDATPVPIENGDYVLFRENRNPLVDQIMIACIPSPNQQDILLVVKRLRIKNKRLILRSESCDEDTKYEDIDITRHQLMGEVIAIAKSTATKHE